MLVFLQKLRPTNLRAPSESVFLRVSEERQSQLDVLAEEISDGVRQHLAISLIDRLVPADKALDILDLYDREIGVSFFMRNGNIGQGTINATTTKGRAWGHPCIKFYGKTEAKGGAAGESIPLCNHLGKACRDYTASIAEEHMNPGNRFEDVNLDTDISRITVSIGGQSAQLVLSKIGATEQLTDLCRKSLTNQANNPRSFFR